MYEYEADSFAYNIFLTPLLNRTLYHFGPNTTDKKKSNEIEDSLKKHVNFYITYYWAIELLFLTIQFLEDFFERFLEKFPEIAPLPKTTTHPKAKARWERLEILSTHGTQQYASEYNEYAKYIFDGVIDHIDALSREQIYKHIRDWGIKVKWKL